jgi:hypothetical protein
MKGSRWSMSSSCLAMRSSLCRLRRFLRLRVPSLIVAKEIRLLWRRLCR